MALETAVGGLLGLEDFDVTARENRVWDHCGLLRILVRRSDFRGPRRRSCCWRRGDGRELADVSRESWAHGNFAGEVAKQALVALELQNGRASEIIRRDCGREGF